MSEEQEPYLTRSDLWPINSDDMSETPLKIELKQSGNRHARKLIKKLLTVIDLPELAHDSIRQEFEYATLDGYRLTMKHLSEMETDNDDDTRGNC